MRIALFAPPPSTRKPPRQGRGEQNGAQSERVYQLLRPPLRVLGSCYWFANRGKRSARPPAKCPAALLTRFWTVASAATRLRICSKGAELSPRSHPTARKFLRISLKLPVGFRRIKVHDSWWGGPSPGCCGAPKATWFSINPKLGDFRQERRYFYEKRSSPGAVTKRCGRLRYSNRSSGHTHINLRRPRKFDDVVGTGPEGGYSDNVLTNKE